MNNKIEELEDYCTRVGITYEEKEQWNDLPEYLPENMMISNYGRIINITTHHIYKNLYKNNYISCKVYIDKKWVYFNIVKLLIYVKYRYMRNKYIKKIIYIDGDTDNCKLSNISANFSILSKTNPEWKIVFTKYKINKFGEVVNINTENMLNSAMNGGYKIVKILDEYNNCVNLFIAITVARLFIPNPDNRKHIEYRDDDKRNCRWDNLEWISFNGEN